MLNLIWKDILIQKRTVLLSFVYIIFFSFAFRQMGSAAFSAAAVAVTYLFVIGSSAYEDKNKADIMLNSLPISRNKLVLAKYISVFVFLLIGTVVYLLSQVLILYLHFPYPLQPISLESLAGAVFSIILLNGIYFPTFFKWGYIKARFVNFILFLLFFFGSSYLLDIINNGRRNVIFLRHMAVFLQDQSDAAIALSVMILALVIYAGSYLLSVKFYRDREF